MIRLLIADNDKNIRQAIKQAAEDSGYQVDEAASGIRVIKMFRRKQYDLIVLDSHLPELSGRLVCRQIRQISDVPIVMISSRSREYDRLKAYEVGVDNYFVKPFMVSELMAYIAALLDRCGAGLPTPFLSCGNVTLNIKTRQVQVDESEVSLAPREYKLLKFLLENQSIVLTREHLLRGAWEDDFAGTSRTVDTHIKSLRQQLAPYDYLIQTVWGIGYKMLED